MYERKIKISKDLYLTSPIPPSVNHYLAYRVVNKNGRPMAMSYKTSEAIKYQKSFTEYVKQEVIKQNWELKPNTTQHFYIDAVFYFDRIDKDPNNYFKCCLDSITDTQMIWVDDNVTCERVQRIYYDPNNPRIELHIYPVDYIGIFDNEEELFMFQNKCKSCSRYDRNCSILNKALTGKIQEDICDKSCLKYKEKKEKNK